MLLRPARALAVLAAVLIAVALLPRSASAADPLDPKAVPEPLKAWTSWVLDGKEDALCTTFDGHSDLSRCAWPSAIELTLDEHTGRFVQKWHIDVARWVPLAGDDKRWPTAVQVDGVRATVVQQSGAPSVKLKAGDHTVAGAFAWDSLPESIRVPPETGLLSLRVRGVSVDWPNRDAQGTVWLQKTATNDEGNALEFVVHRKVSDDIPLILVTRVELHVAGKNREELLGKALPAGFVPMSLQSPLPARLEPDGRLRVQVRPGVFVLELTARSEGLVGALSRPLPDGPWRDGDEVWVFEGKSDYRVVTVEGVPSIDPQQTTLPEAWKRLPAYPMKVGATLTFVEQRRGDADPPPNQLTLSRTLWLDFDGAGYAASDTITGTLTRDSRLSMLPPTALGRVSIGGRDQFITQLGAGAPTGVEVRQGELVVNADSRIPGDSSDIPAVSWAHDFHQVSGTLHLPPGWRLLHATGADEVPGTWVRHWSLLELFLALIIAIAIGRLYGVRWGVIALAMLVLTLPEVDAPKWSWLGILALEGLLRVLPRGRLRTLFVVARLAAVLLVVIFALPFVVQHVREGMYPALTEDSIAANTGDLEGGLGVLGKGGEGSPAGAPAPPLVEAVPSAPSAAASAPAAQDAPKSGVKSDAEQRVAGPITGAGGPLGKARGRTPAPYEQSNAEAYDPGAIVQTGPGLPRWQWTTLDLHWSGPVAATQRLHLYLLSPTANLVLAFLRAGLLLLVLLRLFPGTARFFPRGWGSAVAATVFLLAFAVPAPAKADVPDKDTLQQLQERLLRKPDCSPTCASSGRIAIEVRGRSLRARMDVDASAKTAVPLPGATAQWTPTTVLLDGQLAKGLTRMDDGVLWVELAAGSHQILLEGPMPDRESMQLTLRLKPHRVEVTSTGWSVAGLHEDGLADDDLEFTRLRAEAGGAGASLQPGALPPFVRVERTLHVGLNWQVDTRVIRVTPPGTAVVLELPLLPGESVTTADVRVAGGKALVNMAPQATEASWHSVLEQKSPVKLVAPKSLSWVEVWRADIGPIWHATFAGIPFVHTEQVAGAHVPEWRPWPGEEASVDLVRPEGVPGQTLTIDESEMDLEPGLRATDVRLKLSVRSSRGGDHAFTLPRDAQLESLSINGTEQPARQDGRKVTVPIVPGAQSISLVWREAPGLATVFSTPEVDLGAPSVNATMTVQVPAGRWLLFARGPRLGPAVLYWSLLLVLVALAFLLGTIRWTPLRGWHWLLLAIGLSQVNVIAGMVFVGWLLALGWRARAAESGENLGLAAFNIRQMVLVAWTLVALVILGVSLYQGLLGAPEMQVRGNGSTSTLLRWFTDRSETTLPSAQVISVPILAYRGAMLAWALWIALALLRWLRWGWTAFSTGGAWRRSRPRPVPPFVPPTVPMPPMGVAPPPGAPPPPPPA